MSPDAAIVQARLKLLEQHLEQENPVLIKTVQSFRNLDSVAYRMGLLAPDQSFATQIPWWPLIAILGTFSAGKSTFLNHYLGIRLQRTGNQAVDDRFSVICYGRSQVPQTLPGVALDQDPRFPFYQISKSIDQVELGEGQRIDAYLQLKTCPSDQLQGKILIDSPGFDADAQRTSTLRITDHIIDLSDLVLVFFDARHPEPGAMSDTLRHLVGDTIHRSDSGKFLYILNQIDTTAREDNPEEVVAAWQRALGEKGLTAGRFYTIYNPDAAVPIESDTVRQRFEAKRDTDLEEIHQRMRRVEVERAYRIVGALEKTARDMETKAVPFLSGALDRWRRRALWGDLAVFGALGLGLLGWSWQAGSGPAEMVSVPSMETLFANPWINGLWIGSALLLILGIHFGVRSLAAKSLLGYVRRGGEQLGIRGDLEGAFKKSTRWWHSLFVRQPAGWGNRARRRLHQVISETDGFVQTLNDKFANPSGVGVGMGGPAAAGTTPKATGEQPSQAGS